MFIAVTYIHNMMVVVLLFDLVCDSVLLSGCLHLCMDIVFSYSPHIKCHSLIPLTLPKVTKPSKDHLFLL